MSRPIFITLTFREATDETFIQNAANIDAVVEDLDDDGQSLGGTLICLNDPQDFDGVAICETPAQVLRLIEAAS